MTDTIITDKPVKDDTIVSGKPVADFDLTFKWHSGEWALLFDAQIDFIRSDIIRARAADKLIVYLSCPISGRGGGHAGTNVDIALATQRRLLDQWGEGVWILNPANYQMESRAGTGLMNQHAERLGIDLAALVERTGRPLGGDYMRMWTRVLVENSTQVGRAAIPPALVNTGQYFDAYYFLGPIDMRRFFVSGEESLTAAIETYFARRMDTDPDFRDGYSGSDIAWGTPDAAGAAARDLWRLQRTAFLRFYMFRAGASFSLGSHDEWNIWRMLNVRRRTQPFGAAEQIAGFFEGTQLDLAAVEGEVAEGYAA